MGTPQKAALLEIFVRQEMIKQLPSDDPGARRMMLLDYMGSLLINEPNHFPILTSRPGADQGSGSCVSSKTENHRLGKSLDFPTKTDACVREQHNSTFLFVLQIALQFARLVPVELIARCSGHTGK